MSDKEKEESKGLAIPEDLDIASLATAGLYSMLDQVPVDERLDGLDDQFFKEELAHDTEGLVWRPPELKINHVSGTFDMSKMGVADFSPAEIRVQCIDFRINRALWRPKQSKEDPLPLCNSLEGLNGTVNSTGKVLTCAKCPFSKWWLPTELLAKKDGKNAAVVKPLIDYLDKVLAKRNTPITVAQLASGDNTKLPPPCKESRRLFLLVFDHQEKGFGNQPIIFRVPTSSIRKFDDYRNEISLRKERRSDKTLVPMNVLSVVTTIELKVEDRGGEKYSIVEFKFDRVSVMQIIKSCKQIREEFSEQVMSFAIQLSDFDLDEADDPLAVSEVTDEQKKAAVDELPEISEMDDDGEFVN